MTSLSQFQHIKPIEFLLTRLSFFNEPYICQQFGWYEKLLKKFLLTLSRFLFVLTTLWAKMSLPLIFLSMFWVSPSFLALGMIGAFKLPSRTKAQSTFLKKACFFTSSSVSLYCTSLSINPLSKLTNYLLKKSFITISSKRSSSLIASIVSPLNGGSPETISQRQQPRLHMSIEKSQPVLVRICSGAMYQAVPVRDMVLLTLSSTLQMPKSANLILPLLSSSMFSGLRSLYITLFL